jgi:hypothetical protein
VKFEDTFVSRADRYSLGVGVDSGVYYAAIPVSNQLVDYAEYYELSPDEYQRFSSEPPRAIVFVESCRKRQQDRRLLMNPGTDRGTPR